MSLKMVELRGQELFQGFLFLRLGFSGQGEQETVVDPFPIVRRSFSQDPTARACANSKTPGSSAVSKLAEACSSGHVGCRRPSSPEHRTPSGRDKGPHAEKRVHPPAVAARTRLGMPFPFDLRYRHRPLGYRREDAGPPRPASAAPLATSAASRTTSASSRARVCRPSKRLFGSTVDSSGRYSDDCR